MTQVVEQYLVETFGRETPRPGLQRVGRLYRSLVGDMQPPAPTNIAIAGTNGKGSTVAALAFACRSISLRTLEFSSPHLFDVRERITIDGELLPEAFWLASLATLRQRAQDLAITLSYFEAVFGVALLASMAYKPDVALWEAGLGGRLDAINVIPNFDCVVVTSVGLDHCEILGTTTLAIAREKVALARRLAPLILGDIEPAVLDVLYPEMGVQRVLPISARQPLPPGWTSQPAQLLQKMPWLRANAARAVIWTLLVLDRWQPGDIDWSRMPVPRGRMDRSRWPWIVDVGHNPDAAHSACAVISSLALPAVDLCFNALQRKDAVTMAQILATGVHWMRVWIYDDGGLEFHPAAELSEVFSRAGCRVDTINDPQIFAGVPERPTLVLGSFRLAALVLHPNLFHSDVGG